MFFAPHQTLMQMKVGNLKISKIEINVYLSTYKVQKWVGF